MKKFCLFFLILLWLVSCGVGNAPTPTKPAPNPTRANATVNPPAVSGDGEDALPTLVAITEDTSSVRIDCGDLTVSGKPLRASDTMSAQAAAACFMSALNVCQPAALTLRESATGAIRQFSLVGTRQTCIVRQAFQPDANSAPAVVDCESAGIQDEKLTIKGCSHLGDFILSLGN